MATTSPISIGEYLSGLSGKPDCEYLDGYWKGAPHGKAHAWAIAVAPLPLVWPALRSLEH